MKKENEFQKSLIKELKKIFKGCIVTKLNPKHIQGIPDLLVLYKESDYWWTPISKLLSRTFVHSPPTLGSNDAW